jgi:hypothetical protein
MSQPLQYSIYDEQSTMSQKNNKRNRTYKKKPVSKKVQNFLEAMDNPSGPTDFSATPQEYPAHPQKPAPLKRKNEKENTDVPIESFTQLPEGAYTPPNQEYYNQYVPYFTNPTDNPRIDAPKDALMKKLNYMIHLLEEQQDEKTGNVAEELILYLFLGIFVIFVVDSFARAAKYTR